MKSFSIIKDALTYPFKNWKKMLLLGVLIFFTALVSISPELIGNGNVILGLITLILGFVISFLIAGYHVSMISYTIYGYDEAPPFVWVKNFKDGVEYVILNFMYYIVPITIIAIVSYVTGFFSNILQLGSFIAQNTMVILNTKLLPEELIANTMSTLGLTSVVTIIVTILFLSMFYIGLARFADKDNIIKGMDIGSIINTIDEIGMNLYIAWFIEVLIIVILLLTLNFYIISFPLIGGLLTVLIIEPYIIMFMARSIGLIYNEA